MGIGVESRTARARYGLLLTALAPVVPQILGSAFNIWYNTTVIEPLLVSPALKQRFAWTWVLYTIVAFLVGLILWLRRVRSLSDFFHRLQEGQSADGHTQPLQKLTEARRQLIHLPWFAAGICGVAWFLCIPVFLGALLQVQSPLDPRLLWHLPISFCVSGFIAVTHSFFLVELASHWGLFPVFFRDARADRTPNIFTLSLRGRGIMWAVSASICPIASLLLLIFAPRSAAMNGQWFAVFVGVVGIAFGIFTALMLSWLVAKPIDQLRTAADAVAHGKFDVRLGVTRADEFGRLLGEFDHMVRELKGKEKLRQTFGLHVGRRAAEQILARDPGLSGVEEEITVMFVDMRSWTARTSVSAPADVVEVMNDFFRVTVRVVEEEHRGMVNKYLGDGFMAIFGVGDSTSNHARDAVAAGREILSPVKKLNDELVARNRAPIQIGIGIHSGPAIVGSVGSPQRLEFTAIGNTVNIASRIEGLTKTTDRQLLVTAAVRDRSGDSFSFEELPPQEVRGIEGRVAVFAVR